MAEDTTRPRPLLPILFALLAAHRPACRQDRTFARLALLTLGLVGALGRHTITQVLVALGLGAQDWSAWYRLFSRPRVDYDRLGRCLLTEVVSESPATAPFTVVVDGTQLPRSSHRFPGSSWLKAPRTPKWRPGIHRAQRWVGLSWLTPRSETGDSRAVPLRFMPSLPTRARPLGDVPPEPEWATGLALLGWLRRELDGLGRAAQSVLALADGAYSNAKVWRDLPARTVLLARCARNRALFALPTPTARGRPRRYGERAVTPAAWLTEPTGWQHTTVAVRGRRIPLTYRVEGPYLVKGAADQPLVLLVVKGVRRTPGRRHRRRDPAFWLVNATRTEAGEWTLPLPAPDLLAWAWQRWEVEVMHRELKSGFGLGEQQAWGPTSAQRTPQWVVWAYAVLVLTGYRAWGLGPGPVAPLGRWWGGRRWSLGRLWQGVRQELWQQADFQPVWTRTPDTWGEMARWLTQQTTAALGVRRL